jgi:uncharacterized protein
MKFSLYNNLIEFEGKYILFNALSFKFLYLESFLANVVNQCIENQKPNRIKEIYPAFYQALVTNGFAIDNSFDEFAEVKKLVKMINENKSSYRLIINPTVNCNFSCWYCYENHTAKTKMNSDIYQRILQHINNIVLNDELEQFHLSFFGGEPLLYYSKVILPIAQYTYDLVKREHKKIIFDITSNGYLFNKSRFETLQKMGLTSCQITLDGNKKEHDKTRYLSINKGSYDTIIGNVKIAAKLGIDIVLRINYTEKNIVSLTDIFHSFEDLSLKERQKITLSMNKVWQESNENLGPVVRSFQDNALKFGLKIPDALLSDRVRFSCYADKTNESVINYNGDVYKCNARDFTENRKEGILDKNGNIIWNEIHTIRNKSKLENERCKTCSILPICGGGCSQNSLENRGLKYCINQDKNKIKDQIIELFLSDCNQKIG